VWTGKFADVSDKRCAFIFKQYLKVKAIISFETFVSIYSGHSVTSKKTLIFNSTAVRTSNLTKGMSVQIIPLTSSTKCALAMIALTLRRCVDQIMRG